MSVRLVSGFHKSLITSFAEKTQLFSPTRNVSFSTVPRNLCFRNVSETLTISGLEDVLTSYVFGKKKATQVAHQVWERVVRKGDTVVDATCGNGYDTLTMLKLVADESMEARVYGFDIQNDAIESTSFLLDHSATTKEKELVKLFQKCHTKMAEVLPKDAPVRLVAFNLGYLPGGDKTIVTQPVTTREALESAKDVLTPGGLISLVVYVGHPGGLQELKAVEEFSSELSIESWTCCKLQMMNRPLCPVLIFLFKKC